MILCIDDDSGRYDGLRRMLEDRRETGKPTPLLSVASCRACVTELLPQASAVMLDYDLDGEDGICPRCSEVQDERKGSGYVGILRDHGAPVIVSSASHRDNRSGLVLSLIGNGRRVTEISAGDIEPELRWIGQLAVWGVL